MATITGFTAERMLEIENNTIVDASIVGDNLILEKHDATTIDAGSVRGPEGPQGPNADVGDIKSSIRSSLTGWLLMGTSVSNADVEHPDLWGFAPAAWKSGTTLNLPNMTGLILQGGGTIGAVTGENTKVLVAANLPPHAHTQPAHTHTMAAHTHVMGAHTHSINHDHAAVNSGTQSANHTHAFSDTTSSAGAHTHNYSPAGLYQGGGGNLGLQVGGTGNPMNTTTSNIVSGGAHTHTISGTTGSNNASHYHSVNLGTFTGTSGGASAANTGSGGGGSTGSDGDDNTGNGPGTSTPVSIEQAALRVNFFIKH